MINTCSFSLGIYKTFPRYYRYNDKTKNEHTRLASSSFATKRRRRTRATTS